LQTGQFRLIRLDELGGVQRNSEGLRLVCLMESGGKLAIWGSDEDSRNIDLVLKKGMPCTVECEYIEPPEWGLIYGHSHWVPENWLLQIVAETKNPDVSILQ
jgi:hypothetical protein